MENNKALFHGSDIEKIASHYKVPKDSLVNFAANVNPLGFPKVASKAIASNIDVLSAYPDRDYKKLREVIATYCNVEPEQVMVGNGTSELIALLIEQNFPKKTLILGPTYSEYERELSFSNSSTSYYNLDSKQNFELDVACFLEKLSEGYDLLILCNPNNPTSSFIPNPIINEILKACSTYNTFVMIDETYIEFLFDSSLSSAMPLISKHEHLMILRGVSKFFAAPGLRLGYGVTGNHTLLKNMKNAQVPWSLHSIGAYAGELLFTDSSYINATKILIEKEKRYLLSELNKLSDIDIFKADANFILFRITKEDLTAHEVFLTCLKEGLIIRDCSSFDSLDGEFIRFCIMNHEDNQRLLDVFRMLFS
jgi:threonine-phosphate decarboxylase